MGELRSAVDALVALDLDDLDDAALSDLIVELISQGDRITTITHRALRAQDRRTAWNTDGACSQKQWLAEHANLTIGDAASRTSTARRLAALPQTEQAAADGTISAAQAKIAATAMRDLPASAAVGLDRLVATTTADPARLRAAVDDYTHRTRPESLAEREQRAWNTRRLRVFRSGDGAIAIDGRLDPLGGETVLTALAPLAAPTGADDPRTAEQRSADALVTLCQRSLNAGDLPEVGGARPHVTIVIPAATLAADPDAPPATLDRSGALSGHAARGLACDPAITRVVTHGASQPLDVGRASRVVSVSQRRALAVRDKGCVRCRAPVAWCEAHHITHWADGGATDLANLILLCWRCHRATHEQGWEPPRRE